MTPSERAALAALREAWPQRHLVLIGAAALGCHLDMTWRRTHDLDVTVVAEPIQIASDLAAMNWRHDDRMEQRWHSPKGVLVDMLPVGRKSLASGQLTFGDSGSVMNLTGFDLALRHVTQIALGGGMHLDVASLPVIVLLKMAAWLDRPHERARDLEDLAHTMSDYLEPTDPRRWEAALIDAEVAFEDQAAFALGQDVGRIARAPHRALVEKFLGTVEPMDSIWHAPFARLLPSFPDPAITMRSRLGAFRLGLGTRDDAAEQQGRDSAA